MIKLRPKLVSSKFQAQKEEPPTDDAAKIFGRDSNRRPRRRVVAGQDPVRQADGRHHHDLRRQFDALHLRAALGRLGQPWRGHQ